MNNILIDIYNFEDEIKNIILSKKISYESSSRYFIYGESKNDDTLKNILIRIPPIRLLYNYSNQSFNQLNFPLNPTYSKTKKFNSLILTLENVLQELLNKPNLEWISNFKKIKNIKNIKLNYFNNVKIISDDDKVFEVKDFEAGSEVEIIVNLSHLWLKEKRVGISYDICQIKYKSLKNLIENNYFEIKENKPKIIKEKPPKIKEERNIFLKIPSKKMLEEQKLKLRKINLED